MPASKTRHFRRFVRILLALLGLALFAWLVTRVGTERLLENLRQLGWGILVIFLLAGFSHSFKVLAWRFTFAPRYRTMSLARMFAVRLAGEAVSQLTFAGHVVGETTRALMIRGSVGVVKGISSVVLDRSVFVLTALLVSVTATVVALIILPLSGSSQLYNALIGLVVAATIGGGVLVVQRRWPVFSAGFRALGQFDRLASFVEPRVEGVKEIEETIFDFYHHARRAFWACFGFNLLGHAASVAEVYLVLSYLDVPVSITTAFIIEGLTKLVNIGTVLVPGNLGAAEGGTMLILRALNMGEANGLTLALARRLRGLMWAAVGITVILVDSLRSGKE